MWTWRVEDRARRNSPPRANQCLPPSFGSSVQQQHLNRSPARFEQVEASRDDARVVDHQEVTWFEQVGEIGHAAVEDRPSSGNQQPGRITGFGRDLGNGPIG